MKEENKPALTTIVMGMLGFGSDEGEEFLRQELYNRLYELSKDKDAEIREIFHDARFTKLIGKAYSKDIEEVLFRLGTGKIIEVGTLEDRKIGVSREAKINVREYISQHYPAAAVEKIKMLAKRFRELGLPPSESYGV